MTAENSSMAWHGHGEIMPSSFSQTTKSEREGRLFFFFTMFMIMMHGKQTGQTGDVPPLRSLSLARSGLYFFSDRCCVYVCVHEYDCGYT